jgi:SAM-dependent methyltransferase
MVFCYIFVLHYIFNNTTFMGIRYWLKYTYYKIKYFKITRQIVSQFSEKHVLEIGGPSLIFSNKGIILPIYKTAHSIANVNFAFETIWEGKIASGDTFQYNGNKVGRQYILEASDLKTVRDEAFEGLISSNCLEHTANPIKVLKEWNRVIKPGAPLLLILPNKKYTFDHNRPYTTFQHLKDDFINDVGEDDLSHMEEILSLHDRSMDKGLRGVDFESRCMDNFKNRCMHHHVFSDDLVMSLAKECGFVIHSILHVHLNLVYLLVKQ